MRETVQKKECPEALYVQHLGINFPLQVVIQSIFNPKTTKTTNRFLLNFRRDDGGMHRVRRTSNKMQTVLSDIGAQKNSEHASTAVGRDCLCSRTLTAWFSSVARPQSDFSEHLIELGLLEAGFVLGK